MKFTLASALALTAATAMATPQIGSYSGPRCSGPGPVIIKQTPACGVASLGYNVGRFQRIYQVVGSTCVPRELFLGCGY